MMDRFEKFRNELEQFINEVAERPLTIGALSSLAEKIEGLIRSLRALIITNGFAEESDEIHFFKLLKPEIQSIKIEFIYRYNLILNQPAGPPDRINQYYASVIDSMRNFFSLNAFHYQYFKNGFTEMDKLFFLRNAGPLMLPIDDANDLDPEFSTPMSLLFAKFRAYEMVQQFALDQMIKYGDVVNTRELSKTHTIKWTGESINAVELAYGLYLTGQLNNGNVSLNQIVKWLEDNLDVKIGIVQRRFTEISKRKRLSQTRFIDQMKENILDKISDGNF